MRPRPRKARSRRPERGGGWLAAGIGLLSAGLFVPSIAGLWWQRANLAGGIAALVAGGWLGGPDGRDAAEQIAALHADTPSDGG